MATRTSDPSLGPRPAGMPGVGCGILFFGTFAVAGLGAGVALFFSLIRPEWRANHDYVEGRCVVLDTRLAEQAGEDAASYRPEVLVRHESGGREFRAWVYDAAGAYSVRRAAQQAALDRFVVGREYLCWYDPNDPGKVVLVRGYSWPQYFLLLIPVVFVAMGAGGVYYVLTFKARQDARLERAYARQKGAPDRPADGDYPAVPETPAADPGTTLAVRLRPGTPAAARLAGTGCVLLILAGTSAGFFGVTAALGGQGVVAGLGSVCFGVVGSLFGLGIVVGLWTLGKQALVLAKVPAAQVELSAHPLHAGEAARFLVRQPGPLRVRSLRLLLVSEEEASYTEGTDRRTERKRVFQGELLRAGAADVGADRPYEVGGDLEVPAGAMHSFRSPNNKVDWKLLVQGVLADWPGFERDYPLVVRPARVPAEGQP